MTTRRSSRSQTKAATAAAVEASEPTITPPQDSTIATPHDSAAATPTSSSADTTHLDQTSAQHHVKKDQSLEASDPDVNASSTEDLVHDAVSTPINEEIESVPAGHHHEDTAEHKEEAHSVRDDEPVHEIHLVGHIKGVPHHHSEEHTKEGEHEANNTEAHFGHHRHAAEGHHHSSEDHHSAENHHHSMESQHKGEDEAIKHVKRPVEADSNSEGHVVDTEAQDYLTGAYKSPFRHVHKGEQAEQFA
ncbi:hypothetical protein BGZ81_003583 [Podila clonocystis]|nr:hypothetical protein BGZ81_003583 [Podila clonocystis]